MAKGINSEYANQNAYDCIQVHGGSGFMLEYACQRLYRDARITSIYEGTTQLQTVAAIRYITNGFYGQVIAQMEQEETAEEFAALREVAKTMAAKYNECVEKVNAAENDEYKDFCSRHLYEMAASTIMSNLLVGDASKAPELFGKSARVYTRFAMAEVEKHYLFIMSATADDLADYRK